MVGRFARGLGFGVLVQGMNARTPKVVPQKVHGPCMP